MRELLAAVAFLTRLPVPAAARGVPVSRIAGWFPVVGMLVGAASGGGYGLAMWAGLPPLAAAWAAVMAEVLLTGAMHLDGLADTADGLGGATPAERRRIMKDPRLGTFGGTALILALTGRGVFLAALGSARDTIPAAIPVAIPVMAPALFAVIVVAHAAARWSPVWALARYPYARPEGGTGAALAGASGRQVVMAGAVALAAGGTLAGLRGLVAVVVAGLAGAGTAAYLARRLGGVTGDVCGAVKEVSLLTALAVLAAVPPW